MMDFIITVLIVGGTFAALKLYVRLRLDNSEMSGKLQFLIFIVVCAVLNFIRFKFF